MFPALLRIVIVGTRNENGNGKVMPKAERDKFECVCVSVDRGEVDHFGAP